jgi:hypothetical protein
MTPTAICSPPATPIEPAASSKNTKARDICVAGFLLEAWLKMKLPADQVHRHPHFGGKGR